MVAIGGVGLHPALLNFDFQTPIFLFHFKWDLKLEFVNLTFETINFRSALKDLAPKIIQISNYLIFVHNTMHPPEMKKQKKVQLNSLNCDPDFNFQQSRGPHSDSRSGMKVISRNHLIVK